MAPRIAMQPASIVTKPPWPPSFVTSACTSSGKIPETIRLRDVDVLAMTASCQKCHQHEYANWQAGPHSATYSRIFADPMHNGKRHLMEDCLRCHGMHFDGAIRDLVQPQNTTGPWHITRAGFAQQPTMPCQACHQVHHESVPQSKPSSRISVAGPAIPPSLAIFDRRERMHFAAASLALPQLSDGPRPVKVSPDARQACATNATPRGSRRQAPLLPPIIGVRKWLPATIALRWAFTKA